MTASSMRFEDIPGLDPKNINRAADIPQRPIFIIGGLAGEALGVSLVTVHSPGNLLDVTLAGRLLELYDLWSNRVAYQPPGCEESGMVGLHGFNEQLSGAALHNGGQLFVGSRYAAWMKLTLIPSAEGETLERVTSLSQARIVLDGLGRYLGLDHNDAATLAEVALDFPEIPR